MKISKACFFAESEQIENSKLKINRGFTLIELLVVMAIIGILAALSLTSFNTAQKSSRDTRRKSDLQQYRNSLEAYSSNNSGSYPTTGGSSCNSTGIFLNDGAASVGPLITEYLPAKISDPLGDNCGGTTCNGTACNYNFMSASAVSWVLEAQLETGGWWQVCSTGKAGKPAGGTAGDSTCDL